MSSLDSLIVHFPEVRDKIKEFNLADLIIKSKESQAPSFIYPYLCLRIVDSEAQERFSIPVSLMDHTGNLTYVLRFSIIKVQTTN